MSEGNGALVLGADGGLDLQTLAQIAMDSGFFNSNFPQAVIKVLWGREMGLGPIASLSEINVIKGKPVASANLIATRLKESTRYDYRVREWDDQRCVIEFMERALDGRSWDSLGVASFTIQDADRAGLLRNNVWQQYPKPMLFARAVSAGSRAFTPNIWGGNNLYVDGELDGNPSPPHPVKVDARVEPAGPADMWDADPEGTVSA